MSTHSKIGIFKDQTLNAIYCHFDGGLEWVGQCLLDHVKTEKKVYDLLDKGPLNSLMDSSTRKLDPVKITGCDPNDYGLNFHNVYMGDVSIHHENIRKIMDEEYSYLFYNGQWYYNRCGNEWILLTREMIKFYS